MRTKNILIVVLLLLMFNACKGPAPKSFITVKNGQFMEGESTYHFLGANFWYGMNLGIEGKDGDRERLLRELDRLQEMGITNLRVMSSSEGPDTASFRIVPSLQPEPGKYNEDVFRGLDFLLNEMGKRDMRAVMVLNDFWVWTGGMAQYNAWVNNDSIPYPPPAQNGDWNKYQEYAARFFGNSKANKIYRNFITTVVERKNVYSGTLYKEDPVIMAWQLGNEPRGYNQIKNYQKWIVKTAKFIKSIDKKHLVSLGSEGNTSTKDAGTDFWKDHLTEFLDYTTIHIWVQNWGWFDPQESEKTLPEAIAKAKSYLNVQLELAKKLNKPLIVEEFGIGRDGGSYNATSTVAVRDKYFKAMFAYFYDMASKEKVMAGANFWAWSGEGRPAVPGGMWHRGDNLIGDPPHESQGWYSVYDKDSTTIALVKQYAHLFKSLDSKEPPKK